MKKTIILLTSLLLPIMASAYDAYIDGIYYNFNRTYKTAAVTFYSVSEENQKTYSGKVNIPTSIVYGGITYEVTQIGEWAFYNCSDLTSITIPNSVTSIRTNAFRGCSGLTSVTIPNSVITIEFGAFNETGWYNNQLDGILYLDNWVIGYKGEKTKGELVIADGTKGIANSAFSSCNGLTSVTMPNSVTTIGSSVFSGCTALTDVTISSAVTSIGNWAFQGCSGLSSITIPNSVTDIGVWAFRGCSSLTSVAIPNSITSVVSGAFAECSGLTSVTMPNSITSIKNNAFWKCSSLTSIRIPNSVMSIGKSAFEGCTSLVSVEIPETVAVIEEKAFYNTPWYNNKPDGVLYIGLSAYGYKGTMPEGTDIEIKEGTVSITDNAFSGCTGLKSVTIPSSVKIIGSNAFNGCSSLNSVSLHDGLSHVGWSAFAGCSSLASIDFPNSIETIEYDAFYGCSSLTSISLPEGLKRIEGNTFRECVSLSSIEIPNSVEIIENQAFSDCTDLNSIQFGNGLASIGSAAFYNCSNLSLIEFPNGVKHIGEDAFWGTAWYEKQPKGMLYAGNVFYEYKGGMPADTRLNLREGTLGIAGGAFRNAWTMLVSVSIPESVVCIGERAFGDCRGLTSITIPRNVESIGMMAFYNCTKLDSVITKIQEPYEIDGYIFSIFDEETISDKPTSATLYVPFGMKRRYEETTGWKNFKEIVEMEPEVVEKCATPTISYEQGELVFSCETEGAQFVSEIKVADAKKGNEARVTLVPNYEITVYATADGYADSDVATATIGWRNGTPVMEGFSNIDLGKANNSCDVNGDGSIDVADIATIISEMAARARKQ